MNTYRAILIIAAINAIPTSTQPPAHIATHAHYSVRVDVVSAEQWLNETVIAVMPPKHTTRAMRWQCNAPRPLQNDSTMTVKECEWKPQ